MTWVTWALLPIFLLMLAVLAELVREEHEDRIARRAWHTAADERETVRLPIPNFLIGDPR